MKINSLSPKLQELYQEACKAREHSYSPYSKQKVGASILSKEGEVYSGCNVENSSYGATVCAERVAIQKAVSEKGNLKIKEVMVVTNATPPWPPCGMCRQVISEFGSDLTIYLANLKGDVEKLSFSDLFPKAFDPSHMST